MALGAGSVTPLQMARAYAVFANGGYRVQPYFIQQDRRRPRQRARARQARSAPATKRCACIDARNAFIMDNMMQDVTRVGTGGARRARSAATTSPARPAPPTNSSTPGSPATSRRWSASPGSASTSRRRSARNETGGGVALPIWIGYMEKALKDVPEMPRERARRRRQRCRPGRMPARSARRAASCRNSSTRKRCRRPRYCSRRAAGGAAGGRRTAASRAERRPSRGLSGGEDHRRLPLCAETSFDSAANSSAPSRVSRHAAPSQRK